MFNQTTVILVVVFVLFSLTSIGFILEDRRIGEILEIFRSSMVIIYMLSTPGIAPLWRQLILGASGLSIALWSFQLAFGKEKKPAKHGNSKQNGVAIKNGYAKKNGISKKKNK